MGDGIQISRIGQRFSSHTQPRSRPGHQGTSEQAEALRQRLINAMAEVVAEGGDPRLS
jgi:hypothetical protein